MAHILWHVKIHYRVHTSLPLATVLSQDNLVHAVPVLFFKINFLLSLHLLLCLPCIFFPSGFPTKFLRAFLTKLYLNVDNILPSFQTLS